MKSAPHSPFSNCFIYVFIKWILIILYVYNNICNNVVKCTCNLYYYLHISSLISFCCYVGSSAMKYLWCNKSFILLQCHKMDVKMTGILDQIECSTVADQAFQVPIKAAALDASENWQGTRHRLVLLWSFMLAKFALMSIAMFIVFPLLEVVLGVILSIIKDAPFWWTVTILDLETLHKVIL